MKREKTTFAGILLLRRQHKRRPTTMSRSMCLLHHHHSYYFKHVQLEIFSLIIFRHAHRPVFLSACSPTPLPPPCAVTIVRSLREYLVQANSKRFSSEIPHRAILSSRLSDSPITGICSTDPSFTPPKDAEPSSQNEDQRFWLTEDVDANSDSAASLLLRWMQLHASLHSGVAITSQSAGGFGMRAVVDIPGM